MKKIILLSAIIGVILAFLALIPFVIKIAITLLMTSVGIGTIIYSRYNQNLIPLTTNNCLTVGAISGFISFMIFSIIFLPLVYLLNLFVPITYMGGLVLMLKLSNFALLLMFTLFISTVSVLFNAFFAFLWYCLCNRGENNLIQTTKTFDEQLKENTDNIQ